MGTLHSENEPVLNKTMCRDDLFDDFGRQVVEELNELVLRLDARGLAISSWYGEFSLSDEATSPERMNRGYEYTPLPRAVDDTRFPWFLYWEIAWVTRHAGFRPGQRVLDLGGSSSLFSCYLADRGLDVTTVDLNEHLVANANAVSREMGWSMQNHVMDMRALNIEETFDHVTSICVYEHIATEDRLAINRNIERLLREGGRMSITFDYANPSRLARLSTPDDIRQQFIAPSNLRVRGNAAFFDNARRYLLHPFFHPKISWRYRLEQVCRGHFSPGQLFHRRHRGEYTMGALFLERSVASFDDDGSP